MVVSKINFAVILLLAFLAGGAWGAHEAFMHHWPIVHAKFPGLSDWWNPAVSWTFKYRFPWWYPVQLTDGKHLLFTLHGISVAFAFYLVGRELFIISLNRKLFPWIYLFYGVITLASYSIGNYVTYDWIFG